MQRLWPAAIISLYFSITAFAFPRETAITPNVQPNHAVTAEPPAITSDGALRCSDGATILHTTDCTMGTPVSYCYKPPPPITCDKGYFPSVWHPGHCMEESTCFPTNAVWITTECSNGAYPYSTKTLYSGTLAGGDDTIITSLACTCPPDQWQSLTSVSGAPGFDTYCMPSQSCPPGMTTSTSVNQFCATATASICSDVPAQVTLCECAGRDMTPVYPDGPSATAIGCE